MAWALSSFEGLICCVSLLLCYQLFHKTMCSGTGHRIVWIPFTSQNTSAKISLPHCPFTSQPVVASVMLKFHSKLSALDILYGCTQSLNARDFPATINFLGLDMRKPKLLRNFVWNVCFWQWWFGPSWHILKRHFKNMWIYFFHMSILLYVFWYQISRDIHIYIHPLYILYIFLIYI